MAGKKETYVVVGKKSTVDGCTFGQSVELTQERAEQIGADIVITKAAHAELVKKVMGEAAGEVAKAKAGRPAKVVDAE